MATKLTKDVTRESSFVDYRTNKPIIVTLDGGGKLIKLRAKGERTTYTVHLQQVWVLGGENKRAEIRTAREKETLARKASKKS